MKKLILSLACLLAFLQGQAQDWTKQCVSFDFSYRVEGNIPLSGDGHARLQGKCFCVKAGLVEYWCNGETQWVIDKEAREVYIQAAEDYASFLKSLDVKTSGGKVTGATVTLDEETKLVLDVRNLENAALVDAAEFAFDTSVLTKDYVITDLR